MQKKKLNIRFIVLGCEYAEEACTSSLIYQCEFFGRTGFSSYKEAITELSLDLYSKYYDEYLSVYENRYSQEVKACCTNSLIKDKQAKFCAECGSSIVNKKFDPEDFMTYVKNLHSTTSDSYGDAEQTSNRNLVWWPYWIMDFIGAPKEEIICIAENAEVVLLAALLEKVPDLVNKQEEQEFEYKLDLCNWNKFKKNIQPKYK